MRHVIAAIAATLALAGVAPGAAVAKEKVLHAAAPGDRPLTIGGRRHSGIYREGNTIVAPGGFSAHGYGYPVATAQERREANNARINAAATGLYGYYWNGLGGSFQGGRGFGDGNPFWGNDFSSNVGYNGTPTALAFGPGFANRYLAEHDPADDDDAPGPTPEALGFTAEPDD